MMGNVAEEMCNEEIPNGLRSAMQMQLSAIDKLQEDTSGAEFNGEKLLQTQSPRTANVDV